MELKNMIDVSGQTNSLKLRSPINITKKKINKSAKNLVYPAISPQEKLVISVVGEYVVVNGIINRKKESFHEEWFWASGTHEIRGRLDNLYSALQEFRGIYSDYLNNIDSNNLLEKLQNYQNNQLHDQDNLTEVSLKHQEAWNQVANSECLRHLAYYGHDLYKGFFPKQSRLRNLLDSLSPGIIIEFNWLPRPRSNWIAHVPWGLMFQQSLPNSKEPIDPLGFIGLRYRIEYIAYDPDGKEEALGSLAQTYRIHYLYWGQESQDICQEVTTQRQILSQQWPNQHFSPNSQAQTPKTDLLKNLETPTPNPVNLLYFYCFCDVGDGNNPVLRFGDCNDPSEKIEQHEISQNKLSDRPLVFANACLTLASSLDMANDFKRNFFERGCAAYLGTESEVPIALASRFATIFFHFFYNTVNSQPIQAGEAVWLTKLFLWQHYQNIGGLLYSYVGPYGLYIEPEPATIAVVAAT